MADAAALVQLTPNTTVEFIKLCIAADTPACISGLPGIGKSAIAMQMADHLYASFYPEFEMVEPGTLGGAIRHVASGRITMIRPWFVDLRLAQLDPVDLRGMPDVVNGATIWRRPGFIPTDDGRPGLLFLDEVNRAVVANQNAVLQLVRERRIGDHELPPTWRIAAAINPSGAGTSAMTEALAGRFVHVEMVVDPAQMRQFAADNAWHYIVVAWIGFKPETIIAPLARGERAGPSPRTWEFVSKLLVQGVPAELLRAAVQGAVGKAVADEFLPFAEMALTLGTLADRALMNPTGTEVPDELGVMYALTGALADRVTVATMGNMLAYLDRLPREFRRVTVVSATNRDACLCATPEYISWEARNQIGRAA
jgi:hypothetical protein